MIGNSELETLGDKLQTTLVELMRCRELVATVALTLGGKV